MRVEHERLAMLAFFAKHDGIHSVANDQRTLRQAKELVRLGFLRDLGNNQFRFTGKVFLTDATRDC